MQSRDRPWLGRPDWSAGRVENSSKKRMSQAWLWAALFTVFSVPLLFKLPEEILRKENYPALVALVFPLAGLGFLIQAVRLTVLWMHFGNAFVELRTLPGVIGGSVAGILHAPLALRAGNSVRLTLRSVHRVSVPFSFPVPFECAETTHEDPDNRVLWLLHAKASVPGVDYDAEFELPVFRTQESSEQPVHSSLPERAGARGSGFR